MGRLEERVVAIGKPSAKTSDKKSFNLLSDASDQQRHYIEQAFVNDDVEMEFMKEKGETAEDEMPKEGILGQVELPGWGQWAGIGEFGGNFTECTYFYL